MKFHSPMIIVADIDKSKEFYTNLLNEEIQQDLESYVVFSGGFSMMTREQWSNLTGDMSSPKQTYHSFELYFEEDKLDDFVKELETYPNVKNFTALEEAPWGQRTLRFFDPDQYAVEVSESMEAVVRRLLSSGMTAQEASQKSMMPADFVEKCRVDIEQSTAKDSSL